MGGNTTTINFYYNKVNDIYCIGDLHGNFEQLKSLIAKYGLKDVAIIVCGDIGIGFYKDEYYNNTFKKLNKLFKERNVFFYLFRGNHDDPSYFNGDKKVNLSNIKTIPDYSVIQILTKVDNKNVTRNILCVGGAISIDRSSRILRMDRRKFEAEKYGKKSQIKKEYWVDEIPFFDEIMLDAIFKSGIKIDTVCTHTAPSFCYPITKKVSYLFIGSDKNLKEDLNYERKIMDKIYEKIKQNDNPLTKWIYGHFHEHYTDEIDNVKFVLLDMYINNSFDFYKI